jgi:hypothetical protein
MQPECGEFTLDEEAKKRCEEWMSSSKRTLRDSCHSKAITERNIEVLFKCGMLVSYLSLETGSASPLEIVENRFYSYEKRKGL